ncbi:MAG: sugar phosphate nucleotidyltransferase [Bacteroidia bacterium]
MKVVIPVAGIGSRLRPHTHTQPKALVPVAGKPILGHIVDGLIEAGINDYIFIIGYLGDKIEAFIRQKYPKVKSTFIVQQPREGIGHAVWMAKDLLNEKNEILIVLGDTILDLNLKDFLSQTNSVLGIKKVEDPRAFGVAEIDNDGFIKSLIEKPTIPKSNLALVGIYYIKESKELMNALTYNIENNLRTRNEIHLTDGIMHMIKNGAKITAYPVDNWFDCGGRTNLLETNAILLRRKTNSTAISFPNTIIIEPVSIAENAKITNSIIGPNVSIGENTTVNYSVIRDSIVGSFSEIQNAMIHESVIGSDSSLKGLSQSLNLGDSTEIDFG